MSLCSIDHNSCFTHEVVFTCIRPSRSQTFSLWVFAALVIYSLLTLSSVSLVPLDPSSLHNWWGLVCADKPHHGQQRYPSRFSQENILRENVDFEAQTHRHAHIQQSHADTQWTASCQSGDGFQCGSLSTCVCALASRAVLINTRDITAPLKPPRALSDISKTPVGRN